MAMTLAEFLTVATALIGAALGVGTAPAPVSPNFFVQGA